MPAQISIAKIANGAIKGIVKAHRAYEKCSGGDWLWNAPEYFATVSVAQELAKLDEAKYVTLEHGANAAIEDAGARGRGKLHRNIRANGRFDILLWWGTDGTPRAPIEVKSRVVGIKNIQADLRRVAKVVQRKKQDSSIQFGMVVFYTSCNKRKGFSLQETLTERLEGINSECKALLLGCDVKMRNSSIYEDDDSAWVASAIVIKPIKD